MNRLLIIINKQLNNNPNSPTIPFFPTKTHYSPPCWGGAGGEASTPFFPTKSHHSPPCWGGARGRGFEVGLLSTYDNFPNPTLHQKGTCPLVFPHSHTPRGSQPPHVVDPPLRTPPRCPRRPRLSEDNQVALATRSKTHNRIPGGTVAPKAQC